MCRRPSEFRINIGEKKLRQVLFLLLPKLSIVFIRRSDQFSYLRIVQLPLAIYALMGAKNSEHFHFGSCKKAQMDENLKIGAGKLPPCNSSQPQKFPQFSRRNAVLKGYENFCKAVISARNLVAVAPRALFRRLLSLFTSIVLS